jgi:hypothetical protein
MNFSTETIAMTMMTLKLKTASKTGCLRRLQANNKASRDKGKGKADPPLMSYISHPSIHGKWASHRIDTLQDACDLEKAMRDGNSFALGYMSYINSVGQIPTNPRSVGMEHLIKRYNHIAKEFSSALQKYKSTLVAFKRKQVGAMSIPS